MNPVRTFWLVWNPNGRNPSYQHPFEENAVREAERLALAHPGETFIVMEAVALRRTSEMQRTCLRPPQADQLPF